MLLKSGNILVASGKLLGKSEYWQVIPRCKKKPRDLQNHSLLNDLLRHILAKHYTKKYFRYLGIYIVSLKSYVSGNTHVTGRTVSKDFRDWFRDRLIELSFSLWSWESMWIERGGQRARERESLSDDHWDSTSRRFLNFPSLDTAGSGAGGGVCLLSTLQHTRELCIFLVEGRKKWVKRNIPGIIYRYFTTTLDGLTWVKFFFFPDFVSLCIWEKENRGEMVYYHWSSQGEWIEKKKSNWSIKKINIYGKNVQKRLR